MIKITKAGIDIDTIDIGDMNEVSESDEEAKKEETNRAASKLSG